MCPAARSKSEVLSYASWDGKRVEGGRGRSQGEKSNTIRWGRSQSRRGEAWRGCRGPSGSERRIKSGEEEDLNSGTRRARA